ncbi:hypothetical protein QZH41_002208 [Actinostola sp. cb2023]|nr:hypothetical protein QZH41_002208 [Actinostola sp. cb2023]
MKQAQVPESVLELLLTFSEMMGIYYANEDKRNPRQVLRLYNLAFRHALALESVMLPPKTMTVRILQGIHYHQGIDHAPLIYRMICFRSISAELFEIFFDRLQDITQKTWSKQPQDLVPNAFLHIIAEDEFEQERDTMAAQENEISWWQWTDDGSVEFRDGPQEEPSKPAGPSLCHFRSTTIKSLHEDLEVEWEEVTQNPDNLPLAKLRDKEGKLLYNRMQQSADASDFQQGTPDIQSSNTLPPTNEQDTSYGLETLQPDLATTSDTLETDEASATPAKLNTTIESTTLNPPMTPGTVETTNMVEVDLDTSYTPQQVDNTMSDPTIKETNDTTGENSSNNSNEMFDVTQAQQKTHLTSKTSKALEAVLGGTPVV